MGVASQIEEASLVEGLHNERKRPTLVDWYERAQELEHREFLDSMRAKRRDLSCPEHLPYNQNRSISLPISL